jgi:hypothetical protein
VLLNAKAREHVTTLAIKLTHLLNYIALEALITATLAKNSQSNSPTSSTTS